MKPAPDRSWRRRIFRWLEHYFAVIGLLATIYCLFFNVSEVVTGSMAPTLRSDPPSARDWVLTEKVSYWFRRPRRWEVVTFRNGMGMQVMKRVAGLPGESVSIRKGEIAINGSLAEKPESLSFLKYLAYGRLYQGRAEPCGTGYFVLGDDTRDSLDSRFDGAIDRGQIIGRAWIRLWPLSRMGFVGP